MSAAIPFVPAPARPQDFAGAAPLGPPTDAPPGSRRKVRVLALRARLGLELFHPLDARASDRLGFRPGKNPGPNGDVFRAAALVERCDGPAAC
jgi:hypothetical protein